MIDIGIQNMQTLSLESLFKENKIYKIPHFQREYAWKKDEWSDLFEDIIQSKEKNKPHFFGFMTFKREQKNEASIIEGQQRLATVTIFLAAIRDIYFEKNSSAVDTVEKYIIMKDELSPDEPPKPKIILSDLNKDFFHKYIQKRNLANNKIEEYSREKPDLSNKKLFDCYKYYYQELIKRIEKYSENEQKEYLLELVKCVLRNFGVIITEVKNENVAYNLFQTLNNRGLDLTITDLLKVYLFDLVGESWMDAKDKWDEIRETLSNINLNSFLRHYWLSKERIVKEKDLLGEIQSKYNTKNSVFKLLDELKDEAFMYEALLNPREDYWNRDVVDALKDLQVLSTQQTLPLLLASVQKLTSNDFVTVIGHCTNLVFRYLTIMEKENKVLEKLYSDIALDIRSDKITNSEQVRERLLKEMVTDDELKSTLMQKEFKVAKVATYMLKKIELYLDPDYEKFSDKITLEHILPRNPDKEWKEFLKKNKMDMEEWVNKIGNLTLLVGKVNKQAQNKYFTHKRDDYYSKKSVLKINEELCTTNKWDQVAISKRHNWLINLTLKIWKL